MSPTLQEPPLPPRGRFHFVRFTLTTTRRRIETAEATRLAHVHCATIEVGTAAIFEGAKEWWKRAEAGRIEMRARPRWSESARGNKGTFERGL